MAQSRLHEQTRMLATMLASALPGKSTCPRPQGLSRQPCECPEGLGWHRGWWPGGGEGGLEPGESSGTAPSTHGDLSLPRGPRPWVLSCPRPTCCVKRAATQWLVLQPAQMHFLWQSRVPRIRLIIELIKNKSFTPGEVARQSSVLVFAAGKNIHSHLLINKAVSTP